MAPYSHLPTALGDAPTRGGRKAADEFPAIERIRPAAVSAAKRLTPRIMASTIPLVRASCAAIRAQDGATHFVRWRGAWMSNSITT